jgi:hypothetical protein
MAAGSMFAPSATTTVTVHLQIAPPVGRRGPSNRNQTQVGVIGDPAERGSRRHVDQVVLPVSTQLSPINTGNT